MKQVRHLLRQVLSCNFQKYNFNRASLKTGLNREKRQGASAARKADEARLYALRGGLTQQTACTADFLSNKVFRGDRNKNGGGNKPQKDFFP